MDKEYFLNTGIPPPLHFEPVLHAWNSLSSPQDVRCPSEQSLLTANWEKGNDHYAHLESALSSMVSSPVAPATSAASNDAFAIRELIGKLPPMCNAGGMSMSFPSAATTTTATASSYGGNSSANNSCYTTPLNSPPKLDGVPILNHLVKENLPNLGNLVAVNPPLPALSADPGFAERAAKFSCFGSRSFNGRMAHFGANNAEFPLRSSTPFMGNGKLPRVVSSPSLKQGGSPGENRTSGQLQMESGSVNGIISSSHAKQNKIPGTGPSSNEESSVSDQAPSGETGSKTPNEINSRKRKAISRGKAKEDASNQVSNANKVGDSDNEKNAKRSKQIEVNVDEKSRGKTAESKDETNRAGNNEPKSPDKANQKPPEPPKDYIHVRARRGQATDSHSLAERVRREKISERMKLLQDLVPGCNKVTGKALMLDEIINYVQSLQRQVEFLSMKLASVNPRLEFSTDNLMSKDIFQTSAPLPQSLYPIDSSAPGFYGQQPQQNPQLQASGSVNQCSVDPVDTTILRNLGVQLPPLDGFGDALPQFPSFSEEDLQSIVQMGFPSQSFPAGNQTSHMKVEL